MKRHGQEVSDCQKCVALKMYLSFLSADIAVVEMSDAFRQPSLFYHLGVRESFSMANNIILYCDTNAESLQSLKVSLNGKMEGCVEASHKWGPAVEIGSLLL